MKTNLIRILLVSTFAVFSIFCWTSYAQQKQNTKVVWEYKIFYVEADNAWKLSELGKEGWELVSVRTEEQMVGNVRQMKIYYYLKRSTEAGK